MTKRGLTRRLLMEGKLDLLYLRDYLEARHDEDFLAMHPYPVCQEIDGTWKSYLPDDTNPEGKTLVKRDDEDLLKEVIVSYWKEHADNPTVGELYERWAKEKFEKGDIVAETRDSYDKTVRTHFRKLVNRKIRSIFEEDVEYFLKYLVDEKEISENAYKKVKTILLGLFGFAEQRNYVSFDVEFVIEDYEYNREVEEEEACMKNNQWDRLYNEIKAGTV